MEADASLRPYGSDDNDDDETLRTVQECQGTYLKTPHSTIYVGLSGYVL